MKNYGLRSDYVRRIGNICLKNKLYVLPCDYFYELDEINEGDSFILNLDKSSQEGSHYIGFFKPPEGLPLFFDPLGMPLTNTYIKNGLLKHGITNIEYSKQIIQGGLSFHCGIFVIAFHIIITKGISMPDFISMFSDEDFRKNEQIATSIIREEIEKMY